MISYHSVPSSVLINGVTYFGSIGVSDSGCMRMSRPIMAYPFPSSFRETSNLLMRSNPVMLGLGLWISMSDTSFVTVSYSRYNLIGMDDIELAIRLITLNIVSFVASLVLSIPQKVRPNHFEKSYPFPFHASTAPLKDDLILSINLITFHHRLSSQPRCGRVLNFHDF